MCGQFGVRNKSASYQGKVETGRKQNCIIQDTFAVNADNMMCQIHFG